MTSKLREETEAAAEKKYPMIYNVTQRDQVHRREGYLESAYNSPTIVMLENALRLIVDQDRKRGFPTSREWIAIIGLVTKSLEDLQAARGGK